MKLAAEVDLGEIFQKPNWFCFLTFSSEVSEGGAIWGQRIMENHVLQGVFKFRNSINTNKQICMCRLGREGSGRSFKEKTSF